ncbi:MAG: glycosyltransferase family 39 protein [Candidatus Microgenomates bacterium]|jgi:4-amino-4-deoxy-L-arabinose transferase-like glycosyltransferase
MKKAVKFFIDWIKNNKGEAIILGIILIVAAFCRLYKIDQYMTFLGDEGRDVIAVRKIFTELHPTLIGPGTSVGNMYLGPLYYYMMAVPLLLAGFSPVGPAVMIAILGVITVLFIWYVTWIWFNKKAALVAAGLYAISPTIIYYSRSSWNPNIMPFFALLSVFSVWKVWKERKFNWIIVMGLSFAFVLQSHYMGFLLTPTLFIFWLLTLLKVRKTNLQKSFIRKSIIGFAGFLVLMSPLFIFDIRHDWMNAKAFYAFLTTSQGTLSVNPLISILKIPAMLNLVYGSLIGTKNPLISIVISVAIVAGIVWALLRNYLANKNFKISGEYWVLISWLGFGLLGLGMYRQNIYDHYFGFLFVVPFILLGIFVSYLLEDGKILKLLGAIAILYLVAINLLASPLRKEPNKLLQRSIDVSKVIEKESEDKPFNLAVIADNNYEAGYEYFLLKDNYPVVEIDSQKPDTITSQLLAVCELIPNSKCDPTHNPKAQVANFGWSKIEGSWNVDGVIVYKLVHSK